MVDNVEGAEALCGAGGIVDLDAVFLACKHSSTSLIRVLLTELHRRGLLVKEGPGTGAGGMGAGDVDLTLRAVPSMSKRGATPVHMVAKRGMWDAFQMLVEYGADPNALDARHRSPLTIALASARDDFATRLLSDSPPLVCTIASALQGPLRSLASGSISASTLPSSPSLTPGLMLMPTSDNILHVACASGCSAFLTDYLLRHSQRTPSSDHSAASPSPSASSDPSSPLSLAHPVPTPAFKRRPVPATSSSSGPRLKAFTSTSTSSKSRPSIMHPAVASLPHSFPSPPPSTHNHGHGITDQQTMLDDSSGWFVQVHVDVPQVELDAVNHEGSSPLWYACAMGRANVVEVLASVGAPLRSPFRTEGRKGNTGNSSSSSVWDRHTGASSSGKKGPAPKHHQHAHGAKASQSTDWTRLYDEMQMVWHPYGWLSMLLLRPSAVAPVLLPVSASSLPPPQPPLTSSDILSVRSSSRSRLMSDPSDLESVGYMPLRTASRRILSASSSSASMRVSSPLTVLDMDGALSDPAPSSSSPMTNRSPSPSAPRTPAPVRPISARPPLPVPLPLPVPPLSVPPEGQGVTLAIGLRRLWRQWSRHSCVHLIELAALMGHVPLVQAILPLLIRHRLNEKGIHTTVSQSLPDPSPSISNAAGARKRTGVITTGKTQEGQSEDQSEGLAERVDGRRALNESVYLLGRALALACQAGHMDVVRVLIAAGADVNFPPSSASVFARVIKRMQSRSGGGSGRSPFGDAASVVSSDLERSGNAELAVRRLLITCRRPTAAAALAAGRVKRPQTVAVAVLRFIVGQVPGVGLYREHTPLCNAVGCGNDDLAVLLFSHGASLSVACDHDSFNLLHHACRTGCLRFIQGAVARDGALVGDMLTAPVDTNANRFWGAHFAAAFGHMDVLRFLKDLGYPLDTLLPASSSSSHQTSSPHSKDTSIPNLAAREERTWLPVDVLGSVKMCIICQELTGALCTRDLSSLLIYSRPPQRLRSPSLTPRRGTRTHSKSTSLTKSMTADDEAEELARQYGVAPWVVREHGHGHGAAAFHVQFQEQEQGQGQFQPLTCWLGPLQFDLSPPSYARLCISDICTIAHMEAQWRCQPNNMPMTPFTDPSHLFEALSACMMSIGSPRSRPSTPRSSLDRSTAATVTATANQDPPSPQSSHTKPPNNRPARSFRSLSMSDSSLMSENTGEIVGGGTGPGTGTRAGAGAVDRSRGGGGGGQKKNWDQLAYILDRCQSILQAFASALFSAQGHALHQRSGSVRVHIDRASFLNSAGVNGVGAADASVPRFVLQASSRLCGGAGLVPLLQAMAVYAQGEAALSVDQDHLPNVPASRLLFSSSKEDGRASKVGRVVVRAVPRKAAGLTVMQDRIEARVHMFDGGLWWGDSGSNVFFTLEEAGHISRALQRMRIEATEVQAINHRLANLSCPLRVDVDWRSIDALALTEPQSTDSSQTRSLSHRSDAMHEVVMAAYNAISKIGVFNMCVELLLQAWRLYKDDLTRNTPRLLVRHATWDGSCGRFTPLPLPPPSPSPTHKGSDRDHDGGPVAVAEYYFDVPNGSLITNGDWYTLTLRAVNIPLEVVPVDAEDDYGKHSARSSPSTSRPSTTRRPVTSRPPTRQGQGQGQGQGHAPPPRPSPSTSTGRHEEPPPSAVTPALTSASAILRHRSLFPKFRLPSPSILSKTPLTKTSNARKK